MMCERCGEHEAQRQYTEYREGRSEQQQICEYCARELGFQEEDPVSGIPESSSTLKGKMLGLISLTAQILPGTEGLEDESPFEDEDDDRVCAACGLSANDLRKCPLFGCPTCYDTFKDSLDGLFERIHSAVAHCGRLPGGLEAAPVDVAGLRRALKLAIDGENYEEAARVRDRLRQADPDWESESDSEGGTLA